MPCMKCGCSCNVPSPSPLQLDSGLPASQTLLLPHQVLFPFPPSPSPGAVAAVAGSGRQCVIALRPIELTL